MNPQHLSKSDSWITPQWLLSYERRVLGSIDLDPASSATGNQYVGARQYFTAEDDSLSIPRWADRPVSIHLNPPGGKVGNTSKTYLFWRKLMEQRKLGIVKQAIFICFSISTLQVIQKPSILACCDFPLCIPKERISFLDSESQQLGSRPSHANAIIYVPGTVDHTRQFIRTFMYVGRVMLPA